MKNKTICIAYIISAYKLPENLLRLVTALDGEGSTFIICVDKYSASKTYDEMRAKLSDKSNVYFLPRKQSVYRSFGHVRSTLRGLKFLKSNKIKYDYISLMTGQDYPIKSEGYIQKFLNKNYGKSFMENFPLPSDNWSEGGIIRFSRFYIHTRKKIFSLNRKRLLLKSLKDFPYGMQPWGGSGYWTMHKKHTNYVLNFLDEHPTYTRFFRYTDIPDEIFFQTILMNSHHRHNIINDDLRFVDWSRADEIPAILRKRDLKTLKGTKDIYARKFDSSVDSAVLDLIDSEVLR